MSLNEKLTRLANAIRSKTGVTGLLNFDAMADHVENLFKVSGVTANSAEVLSGKTVVDSDGNEVVGTMPNNGTVNGVISTKAGKFTIPEGYHDGKGSVAISSAEQAKIKATNIATGVTLLGVNGTAKTYVTVSGSFTAEKTSTVTITNSSFKEGQTLVACIITGGTRYGDYTTKTLKAYGLAGTASTSLSESFSGDLSASGIVKFTFANGSLTVQCAYLNGTYNYTLLVQG